MAKRFTPTLAYSLMGISAVVGVGLCFIAPTLANQSNNKIIQTLPQSGADNYIQAIQKHDYASIYEQINAYSPTLNSFDGLSQKLASVYDGVNVNDLTAVESSEDNKMHIVADNTIIHDVNLVKVDNHYIALPILNEDSEYIFEIKSGSQLNVNGFDVSDDFKTSTKSIPTIMDGIDAKNYTDIANVDQYTLTNLYSLDSIEVDGQACELVQDVVSKTYYCGETMKDSSLNDWVFQAAKAIAAYPAQEGSVGSVSNFALTDSDFYKAYRTMENTWFTAHNSATFSNETIVHCIDIGNDNILVQMAMDYLVSASSGSKNYHIGFQMALYPINNGYKIAGFGIDSNLNEAYKGVSYD